MDEPHLASWTRICHRLVKGDNKLTRGRKEFESDWEDLQRLGCVQVRALPRRQSKATGNEIKLE